MRSAGGCDFEKDIDLDQPSSTVPWTAAVLPSVTGVAKTPRELKNSALAVTGDPSLGYQISQANAEVVRSGATLRTARADTIKADKGAAPDAVLVPLDALFETRMRFALRLWRALRGRAPGPDPAALTAPRRRRLVRALRALDAHRVGAGYRSIAQALFGRERVEAAAWKTSPLRDQAIRLWRLAQSLTRGGYLHLLLHPFRRREG